jgi:hypothetical protein
MRVFNLGVIVVALIVLTILIVWLSTAWMAFEKSLGLTFSDINSCLVAERNMILARLIGSEMAPAGLRRCYPPKALRVTRVASMNRAEGHLLLPPASNFRIIERHKILRRMKETAAIAEVVSVAKKPLTLERSGAEGHVYAVKAKMYRPPRKYSNDLFRVKVCEPIDLAKNAPVVRNTAFLRSILIRSRLQSCNTSQKSLRLKLCLLNEMLPQIRT